METIIKQAREVGTSAGVLLPRKWLNKKVVVTLFLPSKQEIIKDIFEILIENDLNEEVMGIYMFGSYARGDYDADSDIDILVITKETNKLINIKNYEIIVTSEKSFLKNLPYNLNYFSILKEAKVILNKSLIEKYSSIKLKLKTGEILKEIGKITRINKESVKLCEENKKNIPDGIIYSIVLRLRELYMMKCMILNKQYSKKEFLEICGEDNYSAWIRVKRNEKEMNNISPDKIKKLLDLSEKWLKELKG